MDLLNRTLWGNRALDWGLAAGAWAFATALLLVLRAVLARRAKAWAERTNTRADDVLAAVFQATKRTFLVVVGCWIASRLVVLPDGVRTGLGAALILALSIQGAFWGQTALAAWIEFESRRRSTGDPAGAGSVRAFGRIAKFAVWAVAVVLAVENLGLDVSALVAGLGIGGIAVALAAQNVLGDVFASLSILLDKPFAIGDFIIVGDCMGVVEHVGLKTTRVRSLSGEQLVFSNTDLLQSRIRNYQRMQERRCVFEFGVVYETPVEKVESIPVTVREVVVARPRVRFERCHFKALGESALQFEVVYHMSTPDYDAYMDVQQAINLELVRRFQAAGIAFAYPTRTLYVH